MSLTLRSECQTLKSLKLGLCHLIFFFYIQKIAKKIRVSFFIMHLLIQIYCKKTNTMSSKQNKHIIWRSDTSSSNAYT